VLATVDGARKHGGALQRGLLRRAQRAEAVVPVVEVDERLVGRHAHGGLRVEEVEGEAEVDERRELADGLVHDAGENVPGHVELLQLGYVGELLGDGADEHVPADVDDGGVDQQAHLQRQAPVELVVEEDDLVQRLNHAADALGDASDEGVVGEDDDGRRGIAEVLGDGPYEAVGVDEDGVEVFVEERRRQLALEVVEPEVEVLERHHLEADVGEDAHEAVVADVELVQQRQPRHALGDDAAEAVGVDVEEGEVGEQAELGRQVPRDVGAVEVDPGHDRDLGVVQRLRADDAVVLAHVLADPVGGVALGVGVEGAAPGLQRDVRAAEARVGEVGGADAVVELEVRRQVAALAGAGLLHGQQLAARDVGGLRARHRLHAAGGHAGCQEQQRCHEAPIGQQPERRVHEGERAGGGGRAH
jgi:hypothetical protein